MCRQRNSTWDATGADPARIDKGSGTQEGAGRGRRDGKPGLGARMWREFAGAPSGISSCGACSGGLRPGGHYPCKSVQPHRRLARSTADGGAPELGREDDSLLFRAAQRRPAPPPCRLARDASGRAGVDVAAGGVGVAAAGTPTRRLPGRRGRAATAGRRALQLLVASSCCSILSLSAPSAPALPRAAAHAPWGARPPALWQPLRLTGGCSSGKDGLGQRRGMERDLLARQVAALLPPPPPLPGTKRTRRVPSPILSGHAR
jgi:hypothetical protein